MSQDRDPSPLVGIITTEHFTLQSARSATISEANGRASIFLGASSSALIAVAFIGQTAGLKTVFTYGLYILAPLIFIGMVTFKRALQTGIEDARYAQRINKLRRFYIDFGAPVADYLMRPLDNDDVAEVMAHQGYVTRTLGQPLLTVAGMIGAIDSFLIGVFAGFATRVAGGGLILAIVLSAAFFVISLVMHLRHQMQAWQRLVSSVP
jgi:hypothetical protein